MTAGIYVHIPFCASKCAYCAFSSFAHLDHLHTRYVDAVCNQTRQLEAPWRDMSYDTAFFGGGTPTTLPADHLERILTAIRQLPGARLQEISIEANPGTVDATSLEALLCAGWNRLSLGVQSLDDRELRMLGRIHTAQEAMDTFLVARRIGWRNISLDLIMGLPGQTLDDWRRSLVNATALAPEHLSLYSLSLEPGTPLERSVAAKHLPEPDPAVVADMYILAQEWLDAQDYDHYEISNWARRSPGDGELPALACCHNFKYWENTPTLGLGSAAATFDGEHRTMALADPTKWIAQIEAGKSGIAESERLADSAHIDETVILGLRLNRGVRWTALGARLGVDVRALYTDTVDDLLTLDLLTEADGVARLTQRGRLLGNRVFSAFLRDA